MITRAPRPEQWRVLWRLRAAGCPVDWEHLPVPTHPLRVVIESSPCGTHLFPVPSGMGILLPLQIAASTALTICRFDMRADWLKQKVSWLELCARHTTGPFRFYCFHEYKKGDSLRFASEEVLNSRLSHPEVLKRGARWRGFLLGTFAEVVAPTPEAKLEATVWIEDALGHEYAFPVSLENGQQIISDCQYVLRPPAEGEELI